MEYRPNHRENHRHNLLLSLQKPEFQDHCIKQFYRFHDLPESDSEAVNIGYVQIIDQIPFLIWFMENWVQWIDSKLNLLQRGTDDFADIFSLRGFTYNEFKLVVSAKIGEDYYDQHRVFDYLFLSKAGERDFFTISNTDDEKQLSENYLAAISVCIQFEISVLSFFFTRKVPLYFPLNALKRHCYMLAQSGSGKSELMKLMIYDLQRRSQNNNNRSIVLMEPHGDLALEMLSFCLNKPAYRRRLVYLDPFLRSTAKDIFGYDLLGADYTFVINPFEINTKNDREINYVTQELSSAFFEVLKSESTTQMDALIEACVETLLRKEGTDISDLKRFMDDEENEELLNLMQHIPNIERSKMASKMRDDRKLNPTKSGIFYRLQTLIGDSEFRRLLTGKSTVDLEKEMNSGKVIIFNLAKAKMGQKASPVFGKLILALIQGIATKRQEIPKEKRKETFCFIDEFQNYVTPSIHNIMAESRKYALHMILAHQVVGQQMDANMKRVIIGNSALKIAGDNELDSLKFMCENMGKLTPRDFEKLPKYSFYVYNKVNKKNGVQMVKAPSFLVKQKPPFYLPKEELKELFLWLANESGYYKRIDTEGTFQHLNRDKIISTQNSNVLYNPKFED